MALLTPEMVLRAYARGLFPMAEGRDDPRLYWVDPEMRGIIPLEAFHVPRRVARRVRSGAFEIRVDTACAEVIERCAEAARGRDDTWINDEIVALYGALHRAGYVHSVEAWRDGALAGGLYGVALGGAFFGESMFSRAPDASKVALVDLVGRLVRGGFRLLDTQFVTPHLETFGAVEVPRARYRALLDEALAVDARFYSEPGSGTGSGADSGGNGGSGEPEMPSPSASRQSRTQMS